LGGDIFKYLIWILDDRCNLNCSHCYVHSRGWRREITKERGLKLIEEISSLGFTDIDFTGGEPLLIPEIFDYIRKSKNLGLNVSINTNGILLNEEIIDFLKENNVYVYVSVDGPFKEIYEKVRGANTFDKLTNNLKLLKEKNLKYSIIFSISKLNYKYAKDMVSFAKKYNAKLCMIPVIPSGEAKKNEIYIEKDELISAIREVKDCAEINKYTVEIWCAPFLRLLFNSPYLEIDSCPITEVLDISPNGDVLLCDVIDLPLSEIRTKSLKEAIEEVIEHPLYKEVTKIKDDCKGCKIEEFCKGGCFARSYILTKSLLSKDPYCPKVSTGVL